MGVGVFRLHGDGQRVLVRVYEHVRGGCDGRVRDSQRQGGDHGDTLCESLGEVVFCQVENFRAEDGSVVVDGEHDEAVREGADSELGKQCGLRGSHFIALVD